MPCPCPAQCRIEDGKCRTCGKRTGLHTETEALMMLSQAIEGGMPAPDLPLHTWLALGWISRKSRVL